MSCTTILLHYSISISIQSYFHIFHHHSGLQSIRIFENIDYFIFQFYCTTVMHFGIILTLYLNIFIYSDINYISLFIYSDFVDYPTCRFFVSNFYRYNQLFCLNIIGSTYLFDMIWYQSDITIYKNFNNNDDKYIRYWIRNIPILCSM